MSYGFGSLIKLSYPMKAVCDTYSPKSPLSILNFQSFNVDAINFYICYTVET